MHFKSMTLSIFILVTAYSQVMSTYDFTVVIPDRPATPTSSEKYCDDIAIVAVNAKNDLYLEFDVLLAGAFREISHNPALQAKWGVALAGLVQKISAQKRIRGIGVTAWSPKDIGVIAPMLEEAFRGDSNSAMKLRLAYLCQTATPDIEQAREEAGPSPYQQS